MKNIIITIGFTLLLISQAFSQVAIQIEDFVKETNEPFSAKVQVATGENKIGALNFEVLYNEKVVTLSGETLQQISGLCNTSIPGIINCVGTETDGLLGDKAILLLNFLPIGKEGDASDLKLNIKTISDVNGAPLGYTKKDGSIILKNKDRLNENSELNETTLNETDIRELANESNLSKFELNPNPTNGIVNISFNAPANDSYQMQILSIDGKILLNDVIVVKANSNWFQLNLSHLPDGLYLLKFKNDEHSYLQKIKILQ